MHTHTTGSHIGKGEYILLYSRRTHMMDQPVMVIYVSLDLIMGQRILTLSEATKEKWNI